MNEPHADLIAKVSETLEADLRIEALWLMGSLARDKGDQFSDVDFLALCTTGSVAAVSAEISTGLADLPPPLLVNCLFGGRVVSIIGGGWRRYDFSLIETAQLTMYDPNYLAPLFNKTGAKPSGEYPPSYAITDQTLLPIVNEFLRLLGLAAVVAGREEYVVLMSGVEQMRGKAIDLMLEENGIGPWARGGHLSRRKLLTEEQYRSLEALPPLSADRASTLANHEALAKIFLPRAKRLAAEIGMKWPTEFEEATRLAVGEGLGISV